MPFFVAAMSFLLTRMSFFETVMIFLFVWMSLLDASTLLSRLLTSKRSSATKQGPHDCNDSEMEAWKKRREKIHHSLLSKTPPIYSPSTRPRSFPISLAWFTSTLSASSINFASIDGRSTVCGLGAEVGVCVCVAFLGDPVAAWTGKRGLLFH